MRAGATTLAGADEAQPLHVRLQNMPSAQPNPLVAALRGVLSFFATIVIIMTLWVIGAAAEGSLQARGSLGATAGGGPGGPATEKGAASHAPKEYSKENMPEASVKTFADVKGCDEAKAELQVRHRMHERIGPFSWAFGTPTTLHALCCDLCRVPTGHSG